MGLRKGLSLLAPIGIASMVILGGQSAGTASAVPAYPIGNEVYTDKDEIPKNGVGYNVAELLRNYSEPAGPSIILPKGVDSTLSVSDAKAVTDQVAISDTSTDSLSVDASKWNSFIPVSASFAKSYGVTFTQGTTKTFTQTDQINLTPKVEGLSATPYYYKTQMSGDRWIYRDGKLQQANIQPNSFTADIVYAQGWEIKRSNGSPAVAGTDY